MDIYLYTDGAYFPLNVKNGMSAFPECQGGDISGRLKGDIVAL